MTRRLRDYQLDAVEAIEKAWARGVQRPAIVLATGLGKTDVIGALATARVRDGRRTLALAHRRELLDQIADRCRMHLPERGPTLTGLVAGELDDRNRSIVAAMVPTLRTAGRRSRFEPFRSGDLTIVDECHHAAARTYLDVLKHFGALDESSGVDALGVTATMYQTRKTGKDLGDVWQDIVFERDVVWAITHGPSIDDPFVTAPVGEGAERGWLVPPKCLSVVVDHLDLSKVKTRAGDYAEGELGAMVAQDADQIAQAWCEHGEDRITVGFYPTRESVEAQHDAFRAHRCARHPAGITCEIVLGDTSTAERGSVRDGTGIYGRLARGHTRVMLGLMVPTEGWDCPPVSCVLWARPTKIQGLALQAWGRGLRPSPETGKADCLILDVVGGTRALSLVMPSDVFPGIEERETRPQACARCGRLKSRPTESRTKVALCVCPPLERDPDGGRVKLRGPATYEWVDLLGEAGDDSGVVWLQTRGGIPFVPCSDRLVSLRRTTDGSWAAGHCHRDRFEKGTRIVSGVTRRQAKEAADAWVKEHVEPTYWSKTAPWRRAGARPSDGQILAATAMGITDPETYSKAALSDELSIRAASRRLDPRPGPGVKTSTRYGGRPVTVD